MKIKYRGESYEMLDAHPAAECLPWHLDRPEFADLIESVRAGFDPRKPILTQKVTGLIIAGRRRTLACLIADAEPEVEEVDWTDEEIISFVRREEIYRRNLTDSERVMAVTELAKLNPKGTNQHTKKEDGSRDPSSINAKSLGKIAEEAGVSRETAKRAAKVKAKAPEIVTAVKEGKLPVKTAARAADLPKPARDRIAASDDPAATAKDELDKAEEPTNPVAVDGWGIPIQPHAAEAFAQVDKFRDLIKRQRQIQKELSDLADTPGGKILQKRMQWHAKKDGGRWEFDSLRNVILLLDDATPTHTVCPWAHNDERPHPDPCPTCLQNNWTGRLNEKSIPPELIAAAKAAYGITEGD